MQVIQPGSKQAGAPSGAPVSFVSSHTVSPPLAFGFFFLALGFLMPGQYPPWESFERQWMAAFGAVLICAAAVMRRRSAALHVPALAAVAALVAVFPPLQFLAGQIWFLSDAALSATYLLGFAMCVVAGQDAGKSNERFVAGLLIGLLFAALVSAGIALVQWQQFRLSMFMVDMRPGGRPYGNLAQPNHLATLSSLGVVALVRQFELRRLSGVTAGLMAIVLGWCLVMTQSRTAWVFVALLVLWWAWHRRRIGLRLGGATLFTFVALFIAGVIAWAPLNDLLMLRPAEGFGTRLQGGVRPIHWATIWDAAWRAPWFGYGWGQVSVAQQAAALDHPASTEWLNQSHNILLDLLVYNGVPAGFALFAFIVWWFVRHIANCRSLDQWVLIAGVGSVFTHALLEYPLDYAYFLLPTALMMGALEAKYAGPRPAWSIPRWAGAAVVAALSAMMVWVGAEYMRVDSAVRQLRFVIMGIGVDKVPTAPVADVLLLDQPREFHRFMLTQAKAGMSAAELEWMRRVSTREPRPPAMLRYALAAALNGRGQEAADTLGRLCKMHHPDRCDEGRASWQALQKAYPALSAVHFPPTHPELQHPAR